MVRKIEKSAKEKSPKSVDGLITKKPEHYELTGRFEQDFLNLCAEKYLPYCPKVQPLAPRPSSPQISAPEPSASGSSKKSREDKKVVHTPTESVISVNDELSQALGFRPTTFTLTHTLEYFLPKIHIQQDHPEKPETVTEVHIKGWNIGDALFGVLINCFSMTSKLHTLNFWRVGLTHEQISQLGAFLANNNTIKRVHIDGNEPLQACSLAQLIQDVGSVTKLRFRHCRLGAPEAKQIALRLGTMTSANTKLLSLDLTGNQIGDEGAEYLAQALRTNRTLLTLSLAQNNIGDRGCQALASVLSRFFMTHEEIVQRRILQSIYHMNESPTLFQRSPSILRRSRPEDVGARDSSREVTITGGSGGATAMGTGGKKRPRSSRTRPTKEAETKDEKSTGRGKKNDGSSPKKVEPTKPATTKTRSSRVTRSGKQQADSDRLESSPEVSENVNPLLEKAVYVEPHGLRLNGNFVLVYLNLARNHIDVKGFEALTEMVKIQTELLNSQMKVNGTGLLKLVFQGNLLNDEDERVLKLQQLLAPRDSPVRSTTLSESGSSPIDPGIKP